MRTIKEIQDLHSQVLKAQLPKPKPQINPDTCDTCGGVHRVRVENKKTGEVRVRLCPKCGRAHVQRVLLTYWPVPAEVQRLATAPIDIPKDHDTAKLLREAYRLMVRLVQEWPPVLVVFDGNYGTGKTHFLAQIAQAALAQGIPFIYANAVEIVRRWLDWDDDNERERARRQILGVPVLLIDEAGAVSGSGDEFAAHPRALFEIVNTRWQASNKLTILAGNHLATRLHPAIRSRAMEGSNAWIDFSNLPDRRPLYARRGDEWKQK